MMTLNNGCNMNEWTTCAIRTALQAQNMPPPTQEIITEFSKDFNIRWNFPNSIERIDASTSEFIARRTPSANILTTHSAIPLFCWLLWMQILNL
jgi:hypothetical protein